MPTLQATPSSSVANSGSSLRLQCQTSTQANDLQYIFYKGSTAITTQNNELYFISSLAVSDSGLYTCKVSLNGIQSGFSNSFQLSVSGESSFAEDNSLPAY